MKCPHCQGNADKAYVIRDRGKVETTAYKCRECGKVFEVKDGS